MSGGQSCWRVATRIHRGELWASGPVSGSISTTCNATMLDLLGLEHTRLTFSSQGRDFRLTDVAVNVIEEVLA